MKATNLTPLAINVVLEDNAVVTIAPSGNLARCAEKSAVVGKVGDIPLYKTTYGDVGGLPAPEDGVIFIVSAMVRMAVPDRKDVFSPGVLVRNAAGEIIGCKGLISN